MYIMLLFLVDTICFEDLPGDSIYLHFKHNFFMLSIEF